MRKRPYHTGKAMPQTGETTLSIDKELPAMLPGWRMSKRGHRYYEGRKNRSDVRGKKV